VPSNEKAEVPRREKKSHLCGLWLSILSLSVLRLRSTHNEPWVTASFLFMAVYYSAVRMEGFLEAGNLSSSPGG
jgi:hypothetical protein